MWNKAAWDAAALVGFNVANPAAGGAGAFGNFTGTDRSYVLCTPQAINNGSEYYSTAVAWTYGIALPKICARIQPRSFSVGTTGICYGLDLVNAFTTGHNAVAGGGYVPTLGGTNADAGRFFSIAADTRASANWIFGCGDGTTANWIDSGVAVTTGQDYILTIDLFATNGASVTFSILNVATGVTTVKTLSTHMPGTNIQLEPFIYAISYGVTPGTGAAYEYVYMEHNGG